MKYTISAFAKEERQFITLKTLSETEYAVLMDYFLCSETVRQEVVYCTIVRDNLFQFFSMVNSYKSGDTRAHYDLDRLLLNWLNSFYCWIEFHENNYKELFAPIKKEYYDSYPEYRIAYELRKQLTHGQMTLNTVGGSAFSNGSFFLMVPQWFQNKTRIKKSVQEELEGMKGILDLEGFAERFIAMYSKCQKEIWQSIACEAKRNAEKLQDELTLLPPAAGDYQLTIKTNENEFQGLCSLNTALKDLKKIEERFLLPKWLLDHPKTEKRYCPFL